MFFYLIYNSSFIEKDSDKNKNVNTLIYGSIVYIVLHALIYANSSLRDSILRYFWIILSVDIISMFLSSEIKSDIQKHNLTQDAKTLLRKKKKRNEIMRDPKPPVEKFFKKNKVKGEKILKNKTEEIDIKETQNILNQIEQDSKELTEEIKKKKVTFEEPNVTKSSSIEDLVKKKMDEDAGSEVSDGSDAELDLESFEKSLLED